MAVAAAVKAVGRLLQASQIHLGVAAVLAGAAAREACTFTPAFEAAMCRVATRRTWKAACQEDSARILVLSGAAQEAMMLRTNLCAGSVVPMEDRALSLSLSTALRDLRDEDPRVQAGVLNRQGAVYRTIVVDGMRQYQALWDCFSHLRYTRRSGDARNLSFFEPPSTGAVYFLATVEPL